MWICLRFVFAVLASNDRMMWNSALCMLHSARTTTDSRRKREEKEGKPERERHRDGAIVFFLFSVVFFSRVPQSRALVTRHLRLSGLIKSGDDPLFVLPSFFLSSFFSVVSHPLFLQLRRERSQPVFSPLFSFLRLLFIELDLLSINALARVCSSLVCQK